MLGRWAIINAIRPRLCPRAVAQATTPRHTLHQAGATSNTYRKQKENWHVQAPMCLGPFIRQYLSCTIESFVIPYFYHVPYACSIVLHSRGHDVVNE